MPVSGERTRERILDAAEALFAERGVRAVSLSDINRAAGQRNKSATQYHFGDIDAVLQEILDRHQPGIEARRRALLAQLDGHDESTRALVEALVMPLAEKLVDDSGTRYLQIQAFLLGDPERLISRQAVRAGAQELSARLARAASPAPRAVVEIRGVFMTTLVFHGLGDFARTARRPSRSDRERFADVLVDSIVGLLEAPSRSERVRRRREEAS